MARNPIERALGVWSAANYRNVMLPGLGVVTCGELCDAIADLKAENERLMKALSEQIDRDISGIFPGERALAERAGGVKVPIGYALVPVEPTDRMVSAYVAAKPKGAGFNHPRKGDDKKAWFAAHEKKCRERWKAMLSVSALTTEPAAPEGRQGVCATEGCDNHATNQFIRGGVGSTYCGDCFVKVIEACETTRPAEQAVTKEMVEALRDIDAEAPAKEPRDDWTSTDLDEAFYEGKLRGFWEMAVYAREALTAALGAQTPPEGTVTGAMVEAVVQAVRPYTMRTLFIDEHRELVRAALKAAMEAGRHD